ncbi:MAG: class I SAM-dependent methyltransferase [Actinomycetota bacterium]
MRAAEIWERWYVGAILAPSIGSSRALRRAGELAEIRDRIIEHATIFPHADVLDLGCGHGLLTFPAAEHAGRAIGLDPTPGLVSLAMSVPAIGPVFACANPLAIPARDEGFDIVIWKGLLTRTSDRRVILREALRVLRDEARLSVSETLTGETELPAHIPHGTDLWRAFGEASATSLGERAFTTTLLAQTFESAGFKEVRVQTERRRTTLEDERAVREMFQSAGAWNAGMPEPIVNALWETLVSNTPMQIVTPEAYVTATKTIL